MTLLAYALHSTLLRMSFRLGFVALSIFGLLSLGQAPSGFAAEPAAASMIMCQKPEISGLYKQCQEVILLQKLQAVARVFARVEKKVLTVPLHQLYEALPVALHQKISLDQKIAISGEILWNNSPDGFQSICQVTKVSQNELIEVSCGRHQNEKIKKTKVLVLKPFNKTS